jgi:predicted ATPase
MIISNGTHLGHYKVISRLGRGAMGEVYEAEDTTLGRRVALKILPADLTEDEDRIRRFKLEARAASALNHPNIVTIHEIGEAEAGRYIVMEFVEGRTLRSLINERIAIDTLISIGIQIAKALSVAHSAGIVHRDIKPDNVMVRTDGYVKVLDFGLARLARFNLTNSDEETLVPTAAGAILGTIGYMSPEQAHGDDVENATDIFSFGIVLYEMATCKHPFMAGSPFAVLQGITSQDPLPPSRLNPDVSQPLEDLILQMLQKDARFRPAAADIETLLLYLAGKSAKVSPKHTARIDFKGHRVGREEERAKLHAGYVAAAKGRGLVLSVAGEPGIGKTTLVEDFLAELMTGGQTCHIARGRCAERLAGTAAYLPFWEALESLLLGTGRESIARLMKMVAPTWFIQMRPTLRGDSTTLLIEEVKAATEERMRREMSAFFQEVSRHQTLVVFFDDLHWADASTVDLLAYLATKFDSMRVLIVVTYRPSELLLNRHPFLRVKLELQAHHSCHELTLGFLNLEEVERYLSLEFRGHRFPAEFAKMIHARTEGNPLFMVDLVRYLRDRQVIAESDGQWALVRPVTEIERELPESVRSMVQRKIDQLGDADRRLLIGSSVQGCEFDSAVIATATKLDPADVEEQLEVLDRVHGFVRLIEERELPDRTLTLRYRFVHSLYQNALYSSLKPTRRASLSAAVAQALLGFYGKRSLEISSRLAFLFDVARDFERASDYFLLAAQDASKVFAYREAAKLAQHGLTSISTLPDSPERAQKELGLQMTLGVSLMAIKGFAAPEVERAYSRARELCQLVGESPQLLKALYGLWMVHVIRAEFQIAGELAGQLMRLARQSQHRSHLMRAHFARGFTSDYTGDHRVARESYEALIALYDPQQDVAAHLFGPDVRPIVLSRLCWVMLVLGYPDQSRRKMEECIALARQTPHPLSKTCALLTLPNVFIDLSEYEKAWAIGEEGLVISIEHGFPLNIAYLNSHLGVLMARRGEVDKGIERLRKNVSALRAIGAEMSITGYYALMAEVLTDSDNTEEGLEMVSEAIETAEITGERFFEAELFRVKGELLLNCGLNKPEAEASFQKAIELARSRGAKLHELRASISLSRLWEQQGKREEAHSLLADVYGWFTEGFDIPDLQSAQALLNE